MPDSDVSDRAIRGMTTSDGFRVVAVDATQTVREAIDRQGVAGDTARLFGELLTGTILVRETTAPKLRVQALLKHQSKGSILADSHADGKTRGLVNRFDEDFELGEDVNLQVMRELPNGELHQGVVRTEAEHGLSASFTTYMRDSEQVESAVGVGCAIDDDGEVTAAGGYLLQRMPDAEFMTLAKLTIGLEHFGSLEEALLEVDADPEDLLEMLMTDVDFDVLGDSPVRFGCNCSRQRFLDSLSTIGVSELEEMASDDEDLELTCDYCASEYTITPNMLHSLLARIRSRS